MCRSRRSFVLAVAAVLACAAPAAAQGRLRDYSIGARVLVAQAEGYRDRGQDGGAGFGFDVGYEPRPGLLRRPFLHRLDFYAPE